MAGIYIHIPFCKQKCSYCNFHFSTNLSLKSEMVDAICAEIILRKDEFQFSSIETIYFGGGTPSLLKDNELQKIFEVIFSNFKVDKEAEITIETNPEDITNEKLILFKKLHINRLSIGVQSFFDEDLVLMNRIHSAKQSDFGIKLSQDFGFENITLDLIYGSTTTTSQMWKSNLEKIIELQIPHFSSYALTVEPKTALEHQIKTKKIAAINEDIQWKQFTDLQQFAKDNNFIQYEISNFGKVNYFSKHNLSYWQGKAYLGIGPSAHSFDGKSKRIINIASNVKYIKALLKNELYFEEENLSENERYNEMIMIGLRTIFGVDLKILSDNFSKIILENFEKESVKLIENGKLKIENGKLLIPEKFYFQADGIASDLFM